MGPRSGSRRPVFIHRTYSPLAMRYRSHTFVLWLLLFSQFFFGFTFKPYVKPKKISVQVARVRDSRSSSSDVAIRYVLTVVWMTTYFLIVGHVERRRRSVVHRLTPLLLSVVACCCVLSWTTAGARTGRRVVVEGVAGAESAMRRVVAVL